MNPALMKAASGWSGLSKQGIRADTFANSQSVFRRIRMTIADSRSEDYTGRGLRFQTSAGLYANPRSMRR